MITNLRMDLFQALRNTMSTGDGADDAAMQFQKIITADIYGGRISTEPRFFTPLPSLASHVGPVT